MAALEGLKGQMTTAMRELDRDPKRDQRSNPANISEEEGEITLIHEVVVLEGEEENNVEFSVKTNKLRRAERRSSQPPPLLGPFGNPPARQSESRHEPRSEERV